MRRLAFRRRYLLPPIGGPALMLLAISAGLWLLWPRGPGRLRTAVRLPEAGAAYVLHDPRETLPFMKPDLFARPSHLGFGRALPERLPDYPFEPHLLSPPQFLAVDRALPIDPLSPPLPPLDGAFERLTLQRPQAEAGTKPQRVEWLFSPALQASGLAFDLPDALQTGGFWRLRLYLLPAATAAEDVQFFIEPEGLEPEQIRNWLRWARDTFAGSRLPHGYIDFFPAYQIR